MPRGQKAGCGRQGEMGRWGGRLGIHADMELCQKDGKPYSGDRAVGDGAAAMDTRY